LRGQTPRLNSRQGQEIAMKLGMAFGVAALLTAVAGGPALAQSATGSGSITVYRPLTVSKVTDLAFGTVIEPAAAAGNGTVVIGNPGGTRSFTGGVTGTASSVTSSAQFAIAGEGAASISVNVPASFNVSSGDNSLTVTTTTGLAGGTGTTNQTLS